MSETRNLYMQEYYKRSPEVREKARLSNQRWRAANKEHKRIKDKEWRDKNIEKARGSWHRYKQKHPERAKLLSKQSYDRNKEAINARRLQTRLATKLQVFEAYGNRCACCKLSDTRFLSIDHVNNDGNLDRRAGIVGYALHRRIIKSNFSDRYQLLCFNCNFAKRITGACPHQEDRAQSARI